MNTDATSLYYLLSTIAQVLAAFISLSGVFVLFKLQEIHKRKLLIAQFFVDNLRGLSAVKEAVLFIRDCAIWSYRIERLIKSDQTIGMPKHFTEVLQDQYVAVNSSSAELKSLADKFENLIAFKQQILILTKISVLTGICTIIYSIAVLGDVSNIPQSKYALLGIIGVAGAVGCILSMTAVIYKSFDELKIV